jgi:hypothetical protein
MEPQKCWEFWECQKETKDQCPAYVTDSGRECFNIADDYCLKVHKMKFIDCFECPWFKKSFGTRNYV